MDDTISSDLKGDSEKVITLLHIKLIRKNAIVPIARSKSSITFKYSIWSNMLNSLTTGIKDG